MTFLSFRFGAVVFDGDDALWSTELLYDRARDAARDEVARAGVDGDEWERVQRRTPAVSNGHSSANVRKLFLSLVNSPLTFR